MSYVRKLLLWLSPNTFLRLRDIRQSKFIDALRVLEKYLDINKNSIDIGAHIGLWTNFLSQRSRKVYAFEPLIVPNKDIRYLFRRKKNVIIYNCALSDKKTKMDIRNPENMLGRATIEEQNQLASFRKIESTSIEVNCLDNFNFENISFIKLDVEGHELSVLQGGINLLQKEKPVLLVEIEERHRSGSIKDTTAFLDSLGYSCYFFYRGIMCDFKYFDLSKHQKVDSGAQFHRDKNQTNEYVNNFLFVNSEMKTI